MQQNAAFLCGRRLSKNAMQITFYLLIINDPYQVSTIHCYSLVCRTKLGSGNKISGFKIRVKDHHYLRVLQIFLGSNQSLKYKIG